jgi:hypothetical protein
MIVREKLDSYVLIKQHDHGLISGEFARRWAECPRPLEPTLYAIANHDAGWKILDASVRWNEETGKPYSFTNYPIVTKLRAYEEGLDLLEVEYPYAACLCSMHYTALVGDSKAETGFRESETQRQREIKAAMSGEELGNLEHNFHLLRLCDDLSLFVCLNEPGRNEHPWYKKGLGFEGARFEPIWQDDATLRLVPNPFSEPFDLTIPYALVGENGRYIESNTLDLSVTC